MRRCAAALVVACLVLTAAAKRSVTCADWRPKTVECEFPGERAEVLSCWNFDEQPCGVGPKGFPTSGWIDPKDFSKTCDSHVYVSNLGAASGPNSLLFDFDDDPRVTEKTGRGYYYLYIPQAVTSGWMFVSFDFRLEKGVIELELRGKVVGQYDVRKTAKVNDLGLAGFLTIDEKAGLRLYGGGGGSVGPVHRFKWQRINLWLPTQNGTKAGVQANGWMRLDELALDGSVAAKGNPQKFKFDPLFMAGPWRCLDASGTGKVRFALDNITYGRVSL